MLKSIVKKLRTASHSREDFREYKWESVRKLSKCTFQMMPEKRLEWSKGVFCVNPDDKPKIFKVSFEISLVGCPYSDEEIANRMRIAIQEHIPLGDHFDERIGRLSDIRTERK